MRITNLFLALVLTILLLPIIILVAIGIKLTSKGPAIHWSKRIGKNNEIFLMPKFRTMHINTPQLATHLLNNSGNFLTPIGGFLRKSSLDELPQLFSVIKGDMNFVGPRPALFNQDDLISMRTAKGVHSLKPGITGWAQINGRDEISLEAKVELDHQYLTKRSLFFDLKILFLTVVKVSSRQDISH